MIKKSAIVIVFILSLLLMTSCNKITKTNYNKIQAGMEKQDVIDILGLPQEIDENLTGDVYYWFDKANSYSQALEKVEKGQTVMCISVVFSLPNKQDLAFVTNKAMINLNDLEKDGN